MAEATDRAEFVYQTYVLLMKVYRVIHRLRVAELSRQGFTIGFTGTSYHIAKYGNGITISELANFAQTEPHTVTEMINKMEKAGLVVKEGDKNDRRVVRVHLTELGIENYRKSSSHRQTIDDVFGCFTFEEVERLGNDLERLLECAEKLEGKKD